AHREGRRWPRSQGGARRQRLDPLRQAGHLRLRVHPAQPRHARNGEGPMTFAELKVDVIILACAVSAGIHGALIADHFEEGIGPGVGFVLATVLLGALAIALTREPSQWVLLAAIAVLAGL